MMATGTLKWFNQTKGYGFIVQDGDGGNLFVHASDVDRSRLNDLCEGTRVQFVAVPGREGRLRARQVRPA